MFSGSPGLSWGEKAHAREKFKQEASRVKLSRGSWWTEAGVRGQRGQGGLPGMANTFSLRF